MFKDQREMSGKKGKAGRITSAGEVQEFWDEHAAKMQETLGFKFETRRGGTDFLTVGDTLEPYVNHNRWVANCVGAGCNGGIALWRDHSRACCLDCGRVYTSINWPSDADIAVAEERLAERPEEEQRNWNPQTEAASDL